MHSEVRENNQKFRTQPHLRGTWHKHCVFI